MSTMKGVGCIVTVTVNVAPIQFPIDPEIGVTVYVAVCANAVGFINVP